MTDATIAPSAPGPIVLAGLSTPWLLERVLGACGVCADGYRPRLLVVEPDPERCLSAFACVEVPESAVVTCFTGPDAMDRFAADLSARFDEALPRTIVSLPGDSALRAAAHDALQRSWREQAAELTRLTNAVATMRMGRDLAWWADRFAGGGDPLRVLVVSSRYSTFVRHAAARLARAVEASGHDAQILIEPHDTVRFSSVAGVRRHLAYDPDLVVSINWPRPVLSSSWPSGVPSVCWVQDAMPQLFDRSVGEAFGPLDFVAGQVHGSLARDFAYPVTNRLFAPVPGCAEVFSPRPAGRDDRFACDVAYVSHQSEPAAAFIDRSVEAASAAPDTARLLRELGQRVLDTVSAARLDATPDLWTLTSDTVAELMGRLPDRGALDRLYLLFALPLGERAFRHESLRWARRVSERNGWSFRVFGNGWEHHPDFADVARPGIAYGDELRSAYANAGCHLHASLQTNAHQRVFECALAGGVMLRRAPSADRSVFQAETAKRIDVTPGGVRLPDGGWIHYESSAVEAHDRGLSDRLALCAPDEIEVGATGGGRRVRFSWAYTFLRPLWVPDHPLELYPDVGFATAGETQFWTEQDLETCIGLAIDNASARSRIVDDQRSMTLSHNTYGAFWGRLRGFVAERLAAQSSDSGERSATAEAEFGRGTLARNLSVLESVAPNVASAVRERIRSGVVRAPGATTASGVVESVRTALESEQVIAIHGVGDGDVLRALLDRPVHLNGRRTAVHVVEPDPDRLLAALAVVDLSEPDGPLLGGDVEWYLGEDWEKQVAERVSDHPMLPLPRRVVRPDPSVAIPEGVWQRLATRFETEQRSLETAIGVWASSRDREESFRALRCEAGRPPRVLVVSSRFTTVLRHSASSAADAFTGLGWQVASLIEDRDHERVTLRAALRLVERFRPDVVLAIDHHRSSFPGLPESIPFVCWIQDDLDSLTSDAAAASLGDADFAIGAWMHRYVEEWGYPERACVGMPRLTASSLRERNSTPRGGIDLCYVSGYSADPRDVRGELLASFDGDPRCGVVARAMDELHDMYDKGRAVLLPRDIAGMVSDAHAREGHGAADPVWVSGVAELLQHRLNNTLFRQQGLRWAAEVATEQGLTLGVFGRGWDRHPEFRAFAKGPVAYGASLDELSAQVPVTLRLEPYPPTSHQRLLDALAAGGFVLSRSYGAWHEDEHAFVGFYLEHLAGHAASVVEAEGRLDEERSVTFRVLAGRVRDALGFTDLDAVMERYDYRHRRGLLADYLDSPLPPRYFETVFSDKAGLRALIADAIADPAHRRSLGEAQGSFVRGHYSYERGLSAAMHEIGTRLLDRLACDRKRGEAA